MSTKQRADIRLTETGQVDSRQKAQALIMAGQVYLGERQIKKASEMVPGDEELTIRGTVDRIASRGFHKLEKAIEVFRPSLEGRVCMDIGAAAGGFTDVLLRSGAGHVYAIDVGYGQFDYQLSQDPRVTVMERTNARTLTPDMFELHPTMTVMDVSFISITKILPAAIGIMGEEGQVITLVKPQFEAGRGLVGKNGVVREESTHRQVLRAVCDAADALGWSVRQLTYSPITGPKGNIEFLADLQPGIVPAPTDTDIAALVKEAHEVLKKGAA